MWAMGQMGQGHGAITCNQALEVACGVKTPISAKDTKTDTFPASFFQKKL